jgi:hypothetical protein
MFPFSSSCFLREEGRFMQRLRFIRRAAVGLVALYWAIGFTSVYAQTRTGTVSGRVALENGDPVHGATVIIVGARRQTTTADDGKFEITNVPPGTYDVLAQRAQLSTSRQTVTITAGPTATLDFKLAVGIHEEITVTGPRAELHTSLGYVRARLTGTDESLPRIPPFHGRVELEAKVGSFSFSPEVVFSSKQDDVFRDETPTAGWATLNFGVSWQRSGPHGSHLLAAQAYNLANKTYRLHTSFLKDLAPEVGRGIKFTYNVRFF